MFVCVVPSHARARRKSASDFSFILYFSNASDSLISANRLVADVWQFNYNERAILLKSASQANVVEEYFSFILLVSLMQASLKDTSPEY